MTKRRTALRNAGELRARHGEAQARRGFSTPTAPTAISTGDSLAAHGLLMVRSGNRAGCCQHDKGLFRHTHQQLEFHAQPRAPCVRRSLTS